MKPTIKAAHAEVADDCVFGEDVTIEADELRIAPGCKIGWSGDDDFRTLGGVRIKAKRLHLGAGVVLGRQLRIEGGDLRFGDGVRILRNSTIRVLDRFVLGASGTVGEQCEITGRDIEIGQELWMLPQAKIGGGSAYEVTSRLRAGHFLHLGMHTLVNTARPVIIGDEVGLGTRTSIYTHGAYPSRLMGFPVAFEGVEIGDFTWVPGATINPGVRIGSNCVIGVNSLVTRGIPDGCLAGGSPAKILREGCFPAPLSTAERMAFYAEFLAHYAGLLDTSERPQRDERHQLTLLDTGTTLFAAAPLAQAELAQSLPQRARTLLIGEAATSLPAAPGWTLFDTRSKRIHGVADATSDRLANELRRYGIRFYSRGAQGTYEDWGAPKPIAPMPSAQ